MDKVNKPKGLIRYTSEEAIATGNKFKVTTRIIGYSIVLTILFGTLITLLSIRTDVEAIVLRTPGMIYQKQSENSYSNLYNINVVNKTFDKFPLTLELVEPKGTIKWVGDGIQSLEPQDVKDGEFFVIIDQENIKVSKLKIKILVKSGDKIVDEVNTNFIGPVK